MKNHFYQFSVAALVLLSVGCNSFMHGYTWNKAENSYHIVTGDKTNFGDRRLKYNKGFHKHSALSNFLDCKSNNRGLPDFIYEYKTEDKRRGIKLFYIKPDSVFVFEEPQKNKLQSIQKEARKISTGEKQFLIR
ncbi:MAG: hypothetical protein QM725_03300 [Lacibacter sp.]